MSSGTQRFDNIFNRLSAELDRLQRFKLPDDECKIIKEIILKYRPEEGPKQPSEPNELGRGIMKHRNTTPYDITVNRLDGYMNHKFTWDYVMEAYDECSPADQERLNELFKAS